MNSSIEMNAHLDALYERYGRETVVISATEAARYLGVDRRTLLADHTFPAKRLTKGGHWRVPLIGLARWLAA